MATLETQLIKAVQEENLDEVRSLIERGAKINISTSGRSPLSIAAHLGNIPMLELLLNSGRFSPQKETPNTSFSPAPVRIKNKNKNKDSSDENHSRRCKRKRQTDEEPEVGNNGYYVVVHEDESKNDGSDKTSDESPKSDINKNLQSIDEVTTPEDMDNLEWDMEVRDGESTSEEEDVWSNQYRWYAKILANTYCSIVETPNTCDVNLQDSIGRCAIHYASEYGHVNAVKLLINAGAKVDIGDVDSLTALHLAANKGHYHVVEALITSGAMVNCKTTDKLSALHYAASRGYTKIVELLISSGASIDSLDATDRTPLKLAVSRNLYNVAKVLVDRGARVNIEDLKGYTPLCEAVWQKSVEMAKLLLDAGAKLTPTPYLLHYAILHQQYEMVELLLKSGSLVNIRDNHGNTPLITASISGQAGIVKLLLNYGAHVDCCGSTSEKTPLSAAITWKNQTSEGVVRALIEGGADINKECWNETPLVSALLKQKYKVAALLIGLGADVTRQVHNHNCRASHGGMGPLYPPPPEHDPPLPFRPVYPIEPMRLARRLKAFSIVKMIVYTGYNLFKVSSITRPRDWPPDTETMDGWLKYHKFSPLGLAELCRIKIRSFARDMIMEKFVSELNLPPGLVRYLLMEDICVTEVETHQSARLSLLPFQL